VGEIDSFDTATADGHLTPMTDIQATGAESYRQIKSSVLGEEPEALPLFSPQTPRGLA